MSRQDSRNIDYCLSNEVNPKEQQLDRQTEKYRQRRAKQIDYYSKRAVNWCRIFVRLFEVASQQLIHSCNA